MRLKHSAKCEVAIIKEISHTKTSFKIITFFITIIITIIMALILCKLVVFTEKIQVRKCIEKLVVFNVFLFSI